MTYQVYALKYAERDLKECQFFFRENSQATLTLTPDACGSWRARWRRSPA